MMEVNRLEEILTLRWGVIGKQCCFIVPLSTCMQAHSMSTHQSIYNPIAEFPQ